VKVPKEEKKRFRFADCYESDYLREPDLMGKEAKLTITAWRYTTAQDVGSDGKPMKKANVIAFKECPKELVLAKVNHVAISRIHGPDPNEWIGKQVIFHPTTCRAFGDPKHPCIRVKGIDPETGKRPEIF
tara:strand:+ start:141 stop:530 length:390 start_codon:yes stop_codon:yes gene_type:complete